MSLRSAPKVLLPGERVRIGVKWSLSQKSVLSDVDNEMGQKTRREVLGKLCRQYARLGLDSSDLLAAP